MKPTPDGFNVDPPTAEQVVAWLRYEEARQSVGKIVREVSELTAWETARQEAGLMIGEVLLQIIHEDD